MAFDPDNLEIYRSSEQEIPLGHIVNQGDFDRAQSKSEPRAVLDLSAVPFPVGKDYSHPGDLTQAVSDAMSGGTYRQDDMTRAVEAARDFQVANFVIESTKKVTD